MFKFRELGQDTQLNDRLLNVSFEMLWSLFWRLAIVGLVANGIAGLLIFGAADFYETTNPSVTHYFYLLTFILGVPQFFVALKWTFMRSKSGQICRLTKGEKDVTNDLIGIMEAAVSIFVRSLLFGLIMGFLWQYFELPKVDIASSVGGFTLGFQSWFWCRYKSESWLDLIEGEKDSV